jgi:hypothetical protein
MESLSEATHVLVDNVFTRVRLLRFLHCFLIGNERLREQALLQCVSADQPRGAR